VLDKFQQGIFALPSNNNVDERGFERLLGSSDGCQPPRIIGKAGFQAFTACAISTVFRIIGPVTGEMARHKASFTFSKTFCL
jgi:hypothetical protein